MAERRYTIPSPPRSLAIPVLSGGAFGEWPRQAWLRLRHPGLTKNDLWRLLWLPFWLGTEMPPLSLPVRRQPLPARRGQAGDQVVATIDSVRRRFWLRHVLTLIMRAVWLTIGAGAVWLLIEFAGGPAFNGRGLLWIGVVLVAMALILGCFVRPTRQQTARMLDRSFQLHERLSTALDNLGKSIPADGERATMVYRQMADAANAAVEVQHRSALRAHLPIRELVMAMAAALLFLALFFLRGSGGEIPPLSSAAIPQFTPASQRLAAQPTPAADQGTKTPTSQEVQEQAARSNAARQALQTLANALNDHAETRPAAESITQGDYQTAANQLKSLANQADKLSPQERSSLGNDLNQAANSMQSTNPDLANAARQAANGLQQGGESAQKGVRNLGNAVEQTGKDVVSQPQLASEMQQAQAAESQSGQAQGQQANGAQSQQSAAQGQSQQASGSQQAAGQAANQQAASGQQGQQGQPSQANAASQQGQQAGSQQSGNQASGAQSQGQPQSGQQGAPGQAQEQGSGQDAGQAAGQQAGNSASSQQGSQAAASQSNSAPSGNGAGAGQSQGQSGTTSSANATNNQQNSSNQGQPPQQKVVQGNGGGPGTQSNNNAQDQSSQTVQLPTDNSGGNQTGSDPSSSSYGSGNGAVEARGSVTQGNVGPNGPDSNRVPAQYRDVVKGYFDQQ